LNFFNKVALDWHTGVYDPSACI